jgi:hypothetical protein
VSVYRAALVGDGKLIGSRESPVLTERTSARPERNSLNTKLGTAVDRERRPALQR